MIVLWITKFNTSILILICRILPHLVTLFFQISVKKISNSHVFNMIRLSWNFCHKGYNSWVKWNWELTGSRNMYLPGCQIMKIVMLQKKLNFFFSSFVYFSTMDFSTMERRQLWFRIYKVTFVLWIYIFAIYTPK